MAYAALRPAAIASIAVAAPVTTSPPENTPSTDVSNVFSFTCTVCHRVRASASPGGSMSGTFPSIRSATVVLWPMAEMMKSHGSRYSDPRIGFGLLRPDASGSPSSQRWHSIPFSVPSSPVTTFVGATRNCMLTPSSIASLISESLAGISVPGPPIEQLHVADAEPERRARAVDGGVPAADDGHRAADVHRPAQAELLEELDPREHAGRVLVLDAHQRAAPRPDAQEDRVVALLLQARDGEVAAEDGVGLKPGPEAEDLRDLEVEDVLGQAVLGDAVAQHASRLGLPLEDVHLRSP